MGFTNTTLSKIKLGTYTYRSDKNGISCNILWQADIYMENFVNQALLYDFYGGLLTLNQKRIYEEVVLNDYSISEVARDEGVSRQSVSDMIKRCSHILMEYENQLGLVDKFITTKKLAEKIKDISQILLESSLKNQDSETGSMLKELDRLAQMIMDIQ